MKGVKRKSALFFMLLAINILLTPNFMVSTVSATADSDAVNLLEANVVWERTYGGAGDDRVFYALAVAENEFVMAGWTNLIGQGHYDVYVVKISVENDGDWMSAYNFVISALILSAIVIVVLVGFFLLIRRYVNQKISRENMEEV